MKGPAFSMLTWWASPVEVPTVIEEVVAGHVPGLGDWAGTVHVEHRARQSPLAGTVERTAQLPHGRVLVAGEAEDLVSVEREHPAAEPVAAQEHLEPGRSEVAAVERHSRFPQTDVGLVTQQFERPIGTAVVDDQEGRYAESPVLREEPGKPRGLVADDQAAKHLAGIDVDRSIVDAAEAVSSERRVMTVQFGERADQELVELGLVGEAEEPGLACIDGVLPAPLVGQDGGQLDVGALQVGVELDGPVEVLQGAVGATSAEPPVREPDLGPGLGRDRRLDPVAPHEARCRWVARHGATLCAASATTSS